MAKLSLKSVQGRYVVKMSGPLRARDLRRLERLCGPALEQSTAPLTLRISRETSIDDPARAYLEHLARRGAHLQFE